MQHVVAPIARAFRPGLIAISAGYDAHVDDPLADCRVETDGYADMAATMREVAAELGAPVLVCLEGGYDPTALAASVLATIEALGSEREAGRGARRVPPCPTSSASEGAGRASRQAGEHRADGRPYRAKRYPLSRASEPRTSR